MNVVNIVPMRAPPPPPADAPHVPVLLDEVLTALDPRPGSVIVDATLGAGGHSEAMLERGAHVVGVDRDDSALQIARDRLLPAYEGRFTAVRGTFGALDQALASIGVHAVSGILADIGVSSMQLDRAERGMSFRHEGPLDMRMDPSSGETALELIDRLDDEELADVIYRFGEERRSRRVARCIKQALGAGDLHTTLDLRRAVVRAVGPARVGGVDPATRTFQALRIAVNRELDELSSLLATAPRLLAKSGTLAIISFHSLEDRIVKRAFADRDLWSPLTKKPVVASDRESAMNPRSRSAKLRAARLSDGESAFDAETTMDGEEETAS